MINGLRAERHRRGLTQMQLSALSGVEQTTISLLELDPDPNPKWYTVRKLARALRVAPDALFSIKEKREVA